MKPLKDWTLGELKEFCDGKRCKDCELSIPVGRVIECSVVRVIREDGDILDPCGWDLGDDCGNGCGIPVMLDDGARMPTRAHDGDAGLDLYAMEDATLDNDTLYQAAIDTGVHMAIPKGYFGKIESRSGLNVKHGVVSCGGVIDSGYTGSIKVKLYNLGTEPYVVKKGDKIAQLVIIPCCLDELVQVDSLDETERGNSGFGSTGR